MARGKAGQRVEPSFDGSMFGGNRTAVADQDDRPVLHRKPSRSGKPGRERRRRGGAVGLIGRLVYYTMVLGIWAVIGVIGVLLYYAAQLPPMSELAVPERPANVRVVSVDGGLIGNRGETGGEVVRLFELPVYLPEAVMAIEDRRFRNHFGIDPVGLARAMLVNVQAGRVVQGGSTLTQQLAKNLFLERDRTMERKIQEVVLALWLEARFDKDAILEMYLNRVYLGAGAYGVEAAAQTYFNKSARDVTLAEAAVIAGLLKAPSRFAPTRDPEAAAARARLVLQAMVETGFITEVDARNAEINPAQVKPTNPGGSSGYVADYVADQVELLLGRLSSDVVVETTVDLRLQAEAESALLAVMALEGAEKKAGQAALVSVDPSGAIKAMVGGRSYSESQYNRATRALRQPGSAFKPFIYAAALETGLWPDTIRNDAPVTFGDWSPSNYSDDFEGPVTLTHALSKSINTIAVRLAAEVGLDRVVEIAERMGIRSEMGNNLSLSLGTSETTLLELTSAYAPLANGGFRVMPHIIERVIAAEDGRVLYERRPPGAARILGDDTVGAMNHMLRETVETGTGRRASLEPRPVAGKTGTAQEFRDAWFIGYTADLVTGVWVGNDDRTPMARVTGGSLPATIWHDFMDSAYFGVAIAELPGTYHPGAGYDVATHDPYGQGVVPSGSDPAQPWYEPGYDDRGPRTQPGQGGGEAPFGGFFRNLFGNIY
ncbi:MAG: PBP1A family penicillin-binding protein [Pseudomonadota bacterium]